MERLSKRENGILKESRMKVVS